MGNDRQYNTMQLIYCKFFTMTIDPRKHLAFFQHLVEKSPPALQGLDPIRMTVLYFCAVGSDVLGGLEQVIPHRTEVIEWIYRQQVPSGGFCAGAYEQQNKALHASDSVCGHITMTHCALALLWMLGEDRSFPRVDRAGIARLFKQCQLSDGSFRALPYSSENDPRFAYSASVVLHLLNPPDWTLFIDVQAATKYLASMQTYEGGFGDRPHAEAQGGMTFCSISALKLLGADLEKVIDVPRLIRWCLRRCGDGFNGRTNKDSDTCYAYWVGCVLAQLGLLPVLDLKPTVRFILGCQDGCRGGISKEEGVKPDPLHSALGLCALSLFTDDLELRRISPLLGFVV